MSGLLSADSSRGLIWQKLSATTARRRSQWRFETSEALSSSNSWCLASQTTWYCWVRGEDILPLHKVRGGRCRRQIEPLLRMKEPVNLTTPVRGHEASLRSLAVWLTLGLGTPLRVSVHPCTSPMSGSQCVLDDAGRRCNLQNLESSGIPRKALSFRVPLRGRIATARSVRESAALVC